MIKELTCICCPNGCSLKVDIENKKVEGNKCKRGEEYGLSELTKPVRVLTTTVKIVGSDINVLPVKTKEPIDKELLLKAMDILRKIEVKAPIKVGDIVLENILDTGVDIIACRDV